MFDIMTNTNNTVLYTGVTSNLVKRVFGHKSKFVKGFTNKYNINKLVYYEASESILSAMQREKQIKGGSRKKKLSLITATNAEFRDLYEEL